MAQVDPLELLARLLRVVPLAYAPAVTRVVTQCYGAAVQPAKGKDLAAADQHEDHDPKPRRARGSRASSKESSSKKTI
jgi:hypothetical protein